MSEKDTRLRSWEEATHRVLQRFHLGSIRNKVLVFSLVATVVPSLALSWQSYVINREFVNERIAEELRNATTHTTREFNLWLKERFYDTRVFSSSYEVTENLEQVLRAPGADGRAAEARRRLIEYLRLVKGKFPDYEELTVIGLDGRVLFTSADHAVTARLPRDWLRQIKADATAVGDAYWEEGENKTVMVIAVPVKAASGRLLGAMAGKLNFGAVEKLLNAFSVGDTGRMHLVNQDGALIASSQPSGVAALKMRLPAEATKRLFEDEEAILAYTDYQEEPVIGSLKRMSQFGWGVGWGVVAEIARQEAYGRVSRIRNLTLVMLGGLVLGIGLTAYLLVLTIVRPLDRLAGGATKVAAGDLQVDLPVLGYGELGYLTRAFNHMVTRLREGREELAAVNVALGETNRELKRLSITDGLTGLFNHKYLMERLSVEVERARRLKHFFSIMMIDVDNFKQYNDTRGHPAGDRLLTEIAHMFKTAIRTIDYAARYGGDEFLLLLHEIGPEAAVQLAERVRSSLGAGTFGQDQHKLTVSIGVASFPEHGGSPEAIIASADAALYEAKRRGRNQIALAGTEAKTDGDR